MKLHTQVAVAIKLVGDAKAPALAFEGSVIDSLKFIGETLSQNSMKTRFDISVARTAQEALDGVNRRGRASGSSQQTEDLDSLWDQLLNQPQEEQED